VTTLRPANRLLVTDAQQRDAAVGRRHDEIGIDQIADVVVGGDARDAGDRAEADALLVTLAHPKPWADRTQPC